MTNLYGVPPSVFSTPTLFWTSLVRDFVHRAAYHNDSTLNHTTLAAAGTIPSMTNDVAAAIRYPAFGACALMGWQLYTVYDSLGFDARRLASHTDSTYTDGHVLTEVFFADYGKFALQDATYNEI